jgi:hypothetical protein
MVDTEPPDSSNAPCSNAVHTLYGDHRCGECLSEGRHTGLQDGQPNQCPKYSPETDPTMRGLILGLYTTRHPETLTHISRE